MYFQHYLLDAIDLVLARELPAELFADAVKDQAKLMARIDPDEIGMLRSD